jgi:hypothetical protein
MLGRAPRKLMTCCFAGQASGSYSATSSFVYHSCMGSIVKPSNSSSCNSKRFLRNALKHNRQSQVDIMQPASGILRTDSPHKPQEGWLPRSCRDAQEKSGQDVAGDRTARTVLAQDALQLPQLAQHGQHPRIISMPANNEVSVISRCENVDKKLTANQSGK